MGNFKDALSQPSAKMALAASSQPSSPHSVKAQLQLHNLKPQANAGESDFDAGSSQSGIQSSMFKQFDWMLQKALKQTSDHITDKLTHEIRELGQRTAELEGRVDELENHTQIYTTEFENIKEENRKPGE